ncbi:hypothetical protein [Rickettsiella endosymbiont of Miltochrista miniata]|uniref:hypothetical protein n=1 Tax=Rickettsiella endosymbiont of Miltochrista miniata TaxID=3066239 RepID=UPI00313CD408
MKVVTDPEILKQLNESDIPTLENKKSSTLSQLTGNPIFRFLAGAGGGIQNSLANLPYSPIPSAPEAQGLSGQLGDVAGNLLSFLGGGEILNTARAAGEGLPLIGRLAHALSGESSAGIARRLSGTALGGALEDPNDRLQGAENGALLAGAGESIPLALKGIHHTAEFINPQHFTNKLTASIKGAYENSKAEAKKYYAAVLDHFGQEKIYAQQSLNHYSEWNKKDNLAAYDAKLKDLHQDFLNTPTLEKAHQLLSQLGSKSSQLSSRKRLDIHTHNAIADLMQARSALQNDIANFLQQKTSGVLNQYQDASNFYKNTVIPYHAEPFISKIAAGNVKTSTPKKLSHALTALTEKEAFPSQHYLQQALEHLNSKINRGKMTSQLASMVTGAGLGEVSYPGGLGALGGLVGGGAAHQYVLPKLLDLAANPYVTDQLKKLNAPYHLLTQSLIAHQLTNKK